MNPIGALIPAVPVAEVIADPKNKIRVLVLQDENLKFTKEIIAKPLKPADIEAFREKLAAKAIKAPASPLRPKSPETF